MINGAKIICLCGSTRFTSEMLVTQWNFTKRGYVVLSWCALPDTYHLALGEDKAHIGDKEGVKDIVDEVHKRKIDLSDEVFVLNIGGYIGESTTSEILYALATKKTVKYLESEWEYPFQRHLPLQARHLRANLRRGSMKVMPWLKGFGFRRKLGHNKKFPAHIPHCPITLLGRDVHFTEKDGVTPVEVETYRIEDQLFMRLPTDRPIYAYYNKEGE